MPNQWTKRRENRRKWVEALRSGKYKQTSGSLHDDNGFCCLGVACEISGLGEWERDAIFGNQTDYRYMGKTGSLPAPVAAWLGLTSKSPTWDEGKWSESGNITDDMDDNLAVRNDEGVTFAEIADIIERVWGI